MTPEQIKTASGYNQATPEKKAIIEGFLNPVKQDAGTIYNSLRTGISVPPSNTPEYKQAQARYNNFRKFSTYDTSRLSVALGNGDLLMGTQTYNDLVSDPTMQARIQEAQLYNTKGIDFNAIGEKQ